MQRQRTRRKEKAVTDPSEMNPLSSDNSVCMNRAIKFLPLQETAIHMPPKALSHSMNVASSTTWTCGRLNKYRAITVKPVTRITGSLGSVQEKGIHALSQTHSRTIFRGLSATDDLCIFACTAHIPESLPFVLQHESWEFDKIFKKRVKSAVRTQLPTLSVAGKDSTAQHCSPDLESLLHKDSGLKKGACSFQIRKRRIVREVSRLGLPCPECVSQKSPVGIAFSQIDSCAVAQAGQIPSQPPDRRL